jgi:putative inorganic carbon (HCO3(-)) transporter
MRPVTITPATLRRYPFQGAMTAALLLLAAAMPLSIAGMGLFLGIGIFLAVGDRFRKPAEGWRGTPLDESLALLAVVTILSALWGLSPGRSLAKSGGMWVFMVYYLFVWYGMAEERLGRVMTVLIGVGAAVSVYAVVQHYTGVNFFDEGNLPTTTFLSGGGATWISRGTFSHHQTFANIVFMIFSLAFSFALTPAPWKRRLPVAAAAAVLWLAIVFSFTRGIWLAGMIAVLLITGFRNRRAAGVTILLVAVLWGALATIPSTYSTRARNIFSMRGNLDRIIIWETSWGMLRDNPILGIGMANYPALQPEYLPPDATITVSRAHAHNTYLQLAIERGIFGLAAFCWMMYVVLRIGLTSLLDLRGREGFRLAAIRGAVAGVVGFLIDGFFQNNFGDAAVTFMLFFVVSVIVGLRVRQVERVNGFVTRGGAHAAS